MQTKICSLCEKEKDEGCFRGIRTFCYECEKKKNREYYQKNREKVKETNRTYRKLNAVIISDKKKKYTEKNKEKRREYIKNYYEKNKEKIKTKTSEYRRNNLDKAKEWDITYREKNKEKINNRNKKYRDENKELVRKQAKISRKKNKHKIAEYKKKYYEKNKEIIDEYRKNYYENNKQKILKNNRDYLNERYKTDKKFKLKTLLRNRIANAIMRSYGEKDAVTTQLLGCDWGVVKQHLEEQFKEGMCWENHGRRGWHIDHIRPCASFDLTDPEQQKECFNYKNLQPLWEEDNLKKGSKY
jgi:hypothetical protein